MDSWRELAALADINSTASHQLHHCHASELIVVNTGRSLTSPPALVCYVLCITLLAASVPWEEALMHNLI